jgi:LuxR family transcriptional regulator, activator of tox operons
MNVLSLDRRAGTPSPLLWGVDRLIGALGTDAFGEELFNAAHLALACEHLTAFETVGDSQPKLILAMEMTGQTTVSRITDRYLKGCWQMDPINDVDRRGYDIENGIISLRSVEETRNCDYRRQCFTTSDWLVVGQKLSERISIARRDGNRTIRVSFHRARDRRQTADEAIGIIASAANILLPLVMRHASNIAARVQQPRGYDSFLDIMRDRFPAMPLREREVCSGIAAGMTSEGIGLTVGVSVNTVLTYRKRAYARLGISSQNELLRLLLS